MSDYLTCVNENGRCGHPFHERAKFVDEHCSRYGAWVKNASECPGCGTLVPAHLGERLVDQVVEELKAKNLIWPKLSATDLPVFVKVMKPGLHICGDCATLVRKMVPGGRLALKSGGGISLFITGADQLRLAETRALADKAKADAIVAEARRLAELAEKARQEEAAAAKKADDYRLALVARIMADDIKGLSFSSKKEKDGEALTSCSIMKNAPNYCICGGWHDWRRMPAVISFGRNAAFSFGPECASLIMAGLTKDPFGDLTYDVAVAACRTGNPRKFLADRAECAAENDRRAHARAVVGPERLYHPHEYGANDKKPRAVKTPPPLPPEEQKKRVEAAELERRLRHEEREAKAKKIANDLSAGAMTPRPPKQKAKKDDKKSSKKKSRGAGLPQQANAK